MIPVFHGTIPANRNQKSKGIITNLPQLSFVTEREYVLVQ